MEGAIMKRIISTGMIFFLAAGGLAVGELLPIEQSSPKGIPEEKLSKIEPNLREKAKNLIGAIQAVPQEKLSDPQVTLGRSLFWDARLSANGKIACASCHLPADGGADRRRFSIDAKDKKTARNSQTVFNAVMQPSLRWIGDRKSGAHQAEKSLTGSMGLASAEAVVPVLKNLGYEGAFRAAFPKEAEPVSPANYAAAIQAYEATLRTPAPFDRYLAGDDDALTEKQKAGLKLFLGSGCVDCHKGPLLGGTSIKKFGVFKDFWTATKSEKKDGGLFEATNKEADRSKFRVSMLRNIAKTGPYFHDGSVDDLTQAIQVMAEVQLGERLSDADASALVAFLESLTGEVPKNYSPPQAPKNQTPKK
jgi:cytochrome c peroxidase